MTVRGERLHAFLHGLFQPSDQELAREVFDQTSRLFEHHGIGTEEGRAAFMARLADRLFNGIVGVDEAFEREHVDDIVAALINYEDMFRLPTIDWSERRSTSDYWTLRDMLLMQKVLVEDFPRTEETLFDVFGIFLYATAGASPAHTHEGAVESGIRVPAERIDLMTCLPALLDSLIGSLFSEEVEERDLFPNTRRQLSGNLVIASGGNPADPQASKRPPKLPSKSDLTDPHELVQTYVGGTPLVRLFDGKIDFTIPESIRFEHHHILAGTGHGKTQTLQYLIASDLDAVERGEASVVVIDSQGDLINTIAGLKRFAPGEPLHDRIVLIDPTDVEYPVSLNLFDVGIDRLSGYPMLESERLTNSILELYDFVLGSLLEAGMTQKQSVIFRYVTRLMLHIPDATIHTLRELMEPNGEVKFAAAIGELTGTARHFFETEFGSREFEQTKRQVLRRLWGILENQTFERMFSHPRSKLDLFAEMNAGKIILINTAKDLLKENGTEIFGRFFIALIAQAAQERAVLPESKRLPTFGYVDEAADYFDRNVGIILAQARKYNVGMVLAHQYLGQLEPKLQEAFAANTSIKFTGGVSNRDAKNLAPAFGTSPDTIERQPRGSFAVAVRGLTTSAVSLQFPFGHVEKMPTMSTEERVGLRERMRERYAVHYTELTRPSEPQPAGSDQPSTPTGEGAEGIARREPLDADNPDSTPSDEL